jgi:hypothetical protein
MPELKVDIVTASLASTAESWIDVEAAKVAACEQLADASAVVLREELARRTQLQTTFGWGPLFCTPPASTAQVGHPNGAFLQLTGEVEEDILVSRSRPGRTSTERSRCNIATPLGRNRSPVPNASAAPTCRPCRSRTSSTP